MTAPLADFFRYAGVNSPDQANSAGAQALLSTLRGYDPNAQFVDSGMNTIEGGSGVGDMSLSYDPSKLPGINGSGQLSPGWTGGEAGPTSGASFSPDFRSVYNPSQVFSPQDIINSPVYGPVANNTAFKPQDESGLFGVLDKALPYAVMSVLGYGAGAAGSSLLGGLGAGGAVGSSLGRTLGNFALGDFMSGGNSKFNPLSLLGTAGAALGLPSWVPSSVSTLAGLAQGSRPQFNPYALAMRYAPYFFGGGGG